MPSLIISADLVGDFRSARFICLMSLFNLMLCFGRSPSARFFEGGRHRYCVAIHSVPGDRLWNSRAGNGQIDRESWWV